MGWKASECDKWRNPFYSGEMMYFGEFNSIQDIADAFQDPSIASFLKESTIHLAMYDHENYEGRAWVIYEHQGQLYEVSASHCSC